MGTPDRVVRAYEEFFAGYGADPIDMLSRTFEETDGYDEMVLLRDINIQSHCEHHMVPIIGVAHIAYIPQNRVVGISKLARIAQAFHPLPEFDGNYPMAGCWVVASRAAGMCIREDKILVTGDDARFIPHVILD